MEFPYRPECLPKKSDHDISRRAVVTTGLGVSVFALAAIGSRPSLLSNGGSSAANTSMAGATNVFAATAATPTATDYSTLLMRHKNMLTGGSGFSPGAQPFAALNQNMDALVTSYLNTLNTASNRTYLWNDPASSTGSANMTTSFVRLRAMAIQYSTAGSSYANSATLLAKIVSGLQWLSDNKYYVGASRAGNWWDWDIGSPLAMLDALIVLDASVPSTLNSALLAAADSFMSTTGSNTAANRAWNTRGQLLRAMAAQDDIKFAAAIDALRTKLLVEASSGDGFHVDGSFIQHSVHPYTGGYGVEMFYQMSWMVYLLAGPNSTWLIPTDWSLMLKWTWNAFEPLLFSGAISCSVMGRNIARNYSTDHYAGATFLGSAALLSAVAASGDAGSLKSLFKTQILADTARDFFTYDPVTGLGNLTMYIASLGWGIRNDTTVPARAELNATIPFPEMDRFVHRKPGWSFTVAGFSTRIANYEAINGENLHGWYTGSGATYFYNQYDLDQFSDDFWPTVDPYRLPGTTVDKRPRADGVSQSSTAQTPMVGSVSDANCGVAAVTIDRDVGTSKARKSWIFIGDYIVCQGSGITNTSGYGVETIIENRNLGASGANGVQMNSSSNAVLTTLEQTQTLAANWLHIDSVGGYLFPGSNAPINGLRTSRSHAWSEINSQSKTPTDLRTRRYLTLWFDHGTGPANGTYGYIFMPNATVTSTSAAYSANQIQRTTTADVHYAYANFSALDVYGAIFWAAGTLGVFTVSAPVAVIVRVTNGQISVTCSDPSQLLTSPVTIRVDLANSSIASTQSSVSVSRTATYATITFNPAGMKGQGGRAVLNI